MSKQYFLELEKEMCIYVLDYKILEKKIAEFYGYDSYDYKYYSDYDNCTGSSKIVNFFEPPIDFRITDRIVENAPVVEMYKVPLDESEQWVIDQVKLKNNRLEFYALETLIKNMYLEGAIDLDKEFMVILENDEE